MEGKKEGIKKTRAFGDERFIAFMKAFSLQESMEERALHM